MLARSRPGAVPKRAPGSEERARHRAGGSEGQLKISSWAEFDHDVVFLRRELVEDDIRMLILGRILHTLYQSPR